MDSSFAGLLSSVVWCTSMDVSVSQVFTNNPFISSWIWSVHPAFFHQGHLISPRGPTQQDPGLTEAVLSWVVHSGQQETSISLDQANSEWFVQPQHSSSLSDPPPKQLMRSSPTSTFPKDHPHSALVVFSVGQARSSAAPNYWTMSFELHFSP